MKPYEPVTQFEADYPDLRVSVEEALRQAGHEPDEFVLSSAYYDEDRVEASYYPRAVQAQYAQGDYEVTNYHWVAVDARRGEHAYDINVRVLEAGGWS